MEEPWTWWIERSSIADMSINELYLLSQVMSTYPRQWNAALKRSLLMDIAVLANENRDGDVHARINRLNEFLLAPLARIVLTEREAMKSSREAAAAREQQLNAAVAALQDEKEAVSKQLEEEKEQTLQQNMFIETLLNDMDKMAKLSDHRKKKILQLQHTLFVKDLQIHRLTSGEREQPDSQVQSFEDSIKDCLQWVSAAETKTTMVSLSLADDQSSSRAPVCSTSSVSSNLGSGTTTSGPDPQKQKLEQQSIPVSLQDDVGLLQLLLAGLWHEGVTSVKIIQDSGLCSVPSAVVHFWLGLARHIASRMAETVQDSALGLFSQLL
ncbi:uncharacterized protein LOC112347884 isoform X2 [Selaginella moellendorffii]|uniref:uncharacterized protein LOC112347884 isoform X2 n=1 Tax=Selaginella moellendorffii TaxID=88036 RepID=UPI000D1CF8DD|nr:uncharacterized protein LOC112347884 isoform X2 [Selaginella moellendorffii]|eukprot:XP_024535239.1 uncharacterized protein LOC112347884 isoform X2 [Selaginella moellendorffii]